MLANIPPSTHCSCCREVIIAEFKELLTKSTFAQTWCLNCLLKWIYARPETAGKVEAINELKKLGVQFNYLADEIVISYCEQLRAKYRNNPQALEFFDLATMQYIKP